MISPLRVAHRPLVPGPSFSIEKHFVLPPTRIPMTVRDFIRAVDFTSLHGSSIQQGSHGVECVSSYRIAFYSFSYRCDLNVMWRIVSPAHRVWGTYIWISRTSRSNLSRSNLSYVMSFVGGSRCGVMPNDDSFKSYLPLII